MSSARPNGGRAATLRTPAVEEQVTGILERDPCTSLRVVARQMDISQSTVNRITTSENLRPYHLNPVQELREHDAPIRVNFSEWLLTECGRDPRFLDKLIVTDEAPFTQSGVRNCHNEHHYSRENPHATRECTHQTRFSINCWGGILGTRLVSIPIYLFLTLKKLFQT